MRVCDVLITFLLGTEPRISVVIAFLPGLAPRVRCSDELPPGSMMTPLIACIINTISLLASPSKACYTSPSHRILDTGHGRRRVSEGAACMPSVWTHHWLAWGYQCCAG